MTTDDTSDEAVPTVADLLRHARPDFTESEHLVAQVLLEQYPMAGLQPVTRLAADAGVSSPTVLRLLSKVGFSGYGEFREALFAEAAAMLASPVNRVGAPSGSSDMEQLLERAETELSETVRSTIRDVDRKALESAVDALSDTERPVLIGGGRMSWILAAHLSDYLQMLRPGVQRLGPESGGLLRSQLDLDERSVVLLFDYRRYQAGTIELGRRASAVGATLLVVTDRYLSPLATSADALLTTAVHSPTPYDGMTGGFALVELLVSAVMERLGDEAQARVTRFDALQAREDER